MNGPKYTVASSALLSAALFLAPAIAAAAAAPAGGVQENGFAGFVHLAQVRGDPAGSTSSGGGVSGGSGTAADQGVTGPTGPAGPAAASHSVTSSVVAAISVSTAACGAVGPSYRTDCLAKELKALVKQLPAQGDYAEAREALAEAADSLADLSRRNRDNSQPRLQITVQSDNQASRRPVAAVKPDTAAETNAKALAILEETTTVLLRSAASNSDVAVHYQRIAQALNSSKVLLRS